MPRPHTNFPPYDTHLPHRAATPSDHMPFLSDAFTQNGKLGTVAARQRRLFFIINAVVLVLTVGTSVKRVSTPRGQFVHMVSLFMSVMASLVGVLTILCKRSLTTKVILFVTYVFSVGILASDWTARAIGNVEWAGMVLVIDFLLVMQMPTCHSVGIVCATVVYLGVLAMEEGFRFGLLDVPGLFPQGERWVRMNRVTQCEALPCAVDTTYSLIGALVVFVIDFVATRGFARDILREQASMRRTIDRFQEIASLLAGYDVERVAELLEAHSHELPEGMVDALYKLERNLRVYKAYLPQTCLPFYDSNNSSQNGTSNGSTTELSATISQSTADPSGSSTSDVLVGQSVRSPLRIGLSQGKASLLLINVIDTLTQIDEDPAAFSDLFSGLVLSTLRATDARRGMVDVFVADKVHCSFNASRQCANHASSALHAATALVRMTLKMNIGIATGKVLRGDMGCEVMRRFSMVGTLVGEVHGMERGGRFFGCAVLCNRWCFSDAEYEHQMRLIPCKVQVAPDCEAQIVAELVVPYTPNTAPSEEEWMYQLQQSDWASYNTVVRGFLAGTKSAEEVNSAACMSQTEALITVLPSKYTILRLNQQRQGCEDEAQEISNGDN